MLHFKDLSPVSRQKLKMQFERLVFSPKQGAFSSKYSNTQILKPTISFFRLSEKVLKRVEFEKNDVYLHKGRNDDNQLNKRENR